MLDENEIKYEILLFLLLLLLLLLFSIIDLHIYVSYQIVEWTERYVMKVDPARATQIMRTLILYAFAATPANSAVYVIVSIFDSKFRKQLSNTKFLNDSSAGKSRDGELYLMFCCL